MKTNNGRVSNTGVKMASSSNDMSIFFLITSMQHEDLL